LGEGATVKTTIFVYRMTRQWILLSALMAGCGGLTPDNSRTRLASVLRDSIGAEADPQVAFQRDSTHLLVELATVAFPTISESELSDEAKSIGGFAFKHYERANELDSVTVLYREKIRSGEWWIRHERTFAVEELRCCSALHLPAITAYMRGH
jgi:hypothetical protein